MHKELGANEQKIAEPKVQLIPAKNKKGRVLMAIKCLSIFVVAVHIHGTLFKSKLIRKMFNFRFAFECSKENIHTHNNKQIKPTSFH